MKMPLEEKTQDAAERITDYRIAVEMVKNMVNAGKLSSDSAALLYTVLKEKYGINSGSIFSV